MSMSIQDQLLPEKHPQTDLFICDVADAVIKDIMPQMEHPFYSLSKKPEMNVRRYEHNGNWIEVIPSHKGLATIYDKDILIYAISQIMAKLNCGEKIDRKIRINCHDMLIFINRGTSGRDYKALCESIDRLAGTRISTNIAYGDEEEYLNFGLVDQGSVRRKNGLDGRLLWIELTISDWVFNAIRNHAVLTLNREYFRLRKPIERRIYEIARKHCGKQKSWSISLTLLHKKSGSVGPLKKFRLVIKHLAKHDHLPDYNLSFDEDEDQVIFQSLFDVSTPIKQHKYPILDPETFNDAKIVAPSYDVYFLEQDWRDWWVESGCPPLTDPNKAFIGFCKRRYERNPSP